MGFMDEYNELKKKRRREETSGGVKSSSGNSGGSYMDEYNALKAQRKTEDTYDRDIGHIMTVGKLSRNSKKEEKEDERKWFQKGAFEDGYDFGDISKTILGSLTDVGENIGAGIMGMGEKAIDALAYLAPAANQAAQSQYGGLNYSFDINEYRKDQEQAKKFIQKDLYNEQEIAKKIISDPMRKVGVDSEGDSVFGEKSDSLVQSGGQLLGTMGLQAVGVPWFVTSGVTSFGGEAENAFNQGAGYEKAGLSAAVSAGAEILTEKLFGGSGLGETGLMNTDLLTRGISNKLVKSLADYGVDIASEGFEEVFSELASNFGSSLYQEEKLKDILFSEEAIDSYVESFIGGGVLGGLANASKFVGSAKKGTDYRSDFTQNEQKVVDKVYQERLAEMEKNGKVSAREKSKLHEQVARDMERGYISTETIEEVLGDQDYQRYKNMAEREDSILKEFEELGNKQNATLAEQSRYAELQRQVADIKKYSTRDALKNRLSESVYQKAQGDRLVESYNEKARKGQAFEADLTQYDAKLQQTIQKAIDSGILNNTNRTHEFVDMVAKISADKGVLFDFTNNAKLKDSGFAVDGKFVNGYVTKDGVTVNIDSAKSMNSIVGHEITHVLEGTEFYDSLKQTMFDYAKSKGDYQGRYDSLSKLYESVEGADIEAELTADLVGDYLFTDSDFISKLSTENRNVFQKIYDEIKYLCKVATAGSKEARELERVKKVFEDAYRAGGKSTETNAENFYDAEAKYSLRVTDKDTLDFLDNQETVTTYKTMQLVDGKLYPPMASRIEGKFEDYSELGTWEQATEHPELIKNGNKFKLDKGKGQGSLEAAYNPYMHSSNLVLNDQFSGAYKRDNLVTVECEVPVSELNSGYHAEYAKDSVGWHPWHTGTVAGQLRKAKGTERQVFLSRWIKPVRIVPDSEVASMYKELLDGTDVEVPDNVVTPALLTELKKAGVKIKESGRVKYSLAEESQKEYADTFYSHMAKVVDGVKQEKLGAASVVNMLRGKGVKAEEIKWSGIEEFLEGKKSVTKAELQEFVKGSMLQLDEMTLEGTDTRWHEYKLSGGSNYREILFRDPKSYYTNDAMDTHWNDAGILAHARVQDFDSQNGKMLFIEEIQSDWHNEGHKMGYQEAGDNETAAALKQKYTEARQKYTEAHETFTKADQEYRKVLLDTDIINDQGEDAWVKWFNDAQKARNEAKAAKESAAEVMDTIEEALVEIRSKVPDAPFRNNYQEFVLKKLIREAAEKGYDSIGWTTAQQQSSRWSDEYAEGYRIEYDQDIPKFLNKYGKKWGAKVGKVALDQKWGAAEDRINAERGFLAEWNDMLAAASNADEAAFIREQIAYTENEIRRLQETGEIVWSMPITPAMKQSVLYEGQVMYSLSDSEGRQLSKEQSEYFRDSKVRDENGNLLAVYHGSKNSGFNIFQYRKDVQTGTDYGEAYYFTSDRQKASGYSYDVTKDERVAKYNADREALKKRFLETHSEEDKNAFLNYRYEGKKLTDLIDDESYNTEGGEVKEVYLNLTNPLIVDAGGKYYYEVYKDYFDRASKNGNDGIIVKNVIDNPRGEARPIDTYIAFSQNQIKAVTNQNPTDNPDIRYSLSNAETDKSYLDAVSSGDTDTARKIMEKVAKRRGYNIRAYHGTARGDRVGNVFLPERATSGPMAFFTDSKEIAENYAKSKQDTSMAYDPDYDRYETQFRIKTKYQDIPLYRAWGYLPFDARNRITRKAGQLREDWDGDNELILDPDTNEANGGFQWQLKEARGNAIQALTEQWLNSGNLFNEEARFLDVLEMAGVTEEFKKIGMDSLYFKDPNAKHEKVYDTFLKIRKPFDTATVDEQFISDLESWYEDQDQSKYVRENMQSDMWDKNGIDAYDFADRLRSDIENNTTHAWTSIPDSVTDYLKHLGYDGIKDTGGKFSGDSHTVWIPFTSSQIKSAETVTYDDAGNVIPITERFDKKEVDIRHSLSNVDDAPKPYGSYNVYGKDIAIAPVAENATTPEDSSAVGYKMSATVSETESVDPAEMAEMFPAEAPVQSELDNLYLRKEELEDKLTEAMIAEDMDAFTQANTEYDSVMNRIEELETEISETENARVNSLDDADVPPEMDAPIYSKPDSVSDPFTDRDWYAVGKNRSTQAFMRENPEFKPFFQEEALVMLGDYGDSQKAERWYNDSLHYESGGERGFGGLSRFTSQDIEQLRDEWGLSWDQIREGLTAIAEDNENVNKMPAKRIEFKLNERLLKGYKDFHTGRMVEPNQGYIEMLRERQANAAAQEAFDTFMEDADMYAPEDIAPVAISKKEKTTPLAPATPDTIDAPIYESKEGLRGQISLFEPPKPNPSVATVLTKESKVQKEKSGIGSKLVSALVDKGMVFENLSLETGNHELQAKYNYALPSNTEARAQHFMESGANSVKSLKNIKKEVGKKTEDFFNYLYHVHNIDRMTLNERFGVPDKTVFGETVTADVSRAEAARLERANPNFKAWAEDVYAYNRHLRNLLVRGNVISRDTADLWEKMYPHYVPIRRANQDGLNISVPLDSRKTGVNNPVKRATGGSSDILPLFETMAMRTEQTYRAIARNDFGIELKNTLGTTIDTPQDAADVDGMIETLEAQEEKLLKPGTMNSSPTFTVFENGERVEFEITEDMYDALKPAGKLLGYRNKAVQKVGDARRNLLTVWNPVFALYRNPIKDIQDVAVNSQHPLKTYVNVPNAIFQMATNGKWAKEYHRNGGKSNTYFDSRYNKFKAEDNFFKKTIGMPVRAIENAGEFIEEIPRLAEYIASRKDGRSVERSMLDSARVTTNFAAGGDFTKFLNAHGFTFLNASVQGASQHVRNFREAKANGLKGYVKVLAKYTVAGLPGIMLNSLLWDDDEDYEELNDYVKQNYYVVAKTEDGKFVRLPKGRTAAVIQNAMEQMQNLVTGDDEVDFATFFELFMNNIAPNNPIENNILAPIAQTLSNNAWYGGDIVPSRLQSLPAEEQFDESTDSISKWLGEKTGTSPVKWNYLIDQYSGGLGEVFLPMLTPEAENGDNSFAGNMLAPWKKEITTDKVLNNKNPGDFYDLRDELEKQSNSSSATQEDEMRTMYMDSVSWEMSDLYAQKRKVQNSSLPDNEKYEKVRRIQEQINNLAKNAMGVYNHVDIDGLYSEVGDKRYNQDAESGKWYEIREKNSDGSDNYYYQKEQEVTKGLGISYGEYWNNREEYNYAYDNPEKYTFAKAVGGYESFRSHTSKLWDIKADKDENGKSISGSRKAKVIDYIDNMDADYGEKIILFKSEYPADDTYNEDIIDYLNSRDDISYDEMVTILKYLEFEVDEDGTVRWD